MLFSPNKYRMREIFFGLRESSLLLPPSSVYGGLDGSTFLSLLAFFHNSLITADYQPARCLPICSLYTYIATDICRNVVLAVKGRLMMARALLRCRSLTAMWWTLYSVSQGHDLPKPLLAGEVLDGTIAEVQAMDAVVPYRTYEDPFSESNKKAVTVLSELVVTVEGGGDASEKYGDYNLHVFRYLQAEFLVCISSYPRVFAQIGDPEEKERLARLDKADGMLAKLWQDITGNEDDLLAWSTGLREARMNSQKKIESADGGDAGEAKPADLMATPTQALKEEQSELCVDIRLLRSSLWELRGDLGRALLEVNYAMHFMRLLADKGPNKDCIAAGLEARSHPDMKIWMMLRRRMVYLLVAQGRLDAANAHIELGLTECRQASDELTRVELLAARARADTLGGKILEVNKDKRTGALPTGERCLSIATKHLPVLTKSAVYARMSLYLLLEQNPSLLGNISTRAPSEISDHSARKAGEEEVSAEELLEAQNQVIFSPIAKELQARNRAEGRNKGGRVALSYDEYRDCQLHLAEMLVESEADLDQLLQVQNFELHPYNMNTLLHIGDKEDRSELLRPPLLPPPKGSFRDQVESDSREPPNLYLEVMPLRCHCELMLAKLRLNLGDLDQTRRLLQEAEARIARCVHFPPWLFVQFCILKCQWRRLDLRTRGGYATALPADEGAPPPAVNYRNPGTFGDGICPPTDCPVFRTFLKKARTPSLTHDTKWIPSDLHAPVANPLDQFLQELLAIIRISALEGGHDYSHLFALLREGLEEVLRCFSARSDAAHQQGGLDSETVSKAYDMMHTHFSCLVATADLRKALQFETAELASAGGAPPDPKGKDAKGGGGGADKAAAPAAPVDVNLLPPRIKLDIQRCLERQPHEGALAYSALAQAEMQKALGFQTVVKHGFALRRECDQFASMFHSERVVADQLHVAMTQASEPYRKAKVLDESRLKDFEAPPEAPTTGDVLVHWTQSDITISMLPPSESCALLVFICPLPAAGDTPALPPLIARTNDVSRYELRLLYDGLCADLEHCKPAEAVATDYLEQRLWAFVHAIRGLALGGNGEGETGATTGPGGSNDATTRPPEGEPELEQALLRLILSLAKEAEGGGTTAGTPMPPAAEGEEQAEEPPHRPEKAEAWKVQDLLKALVKLLDPSSAASRVSHPELSSFLREALAPLNVFPPS